MVAAGAGGLGGVLGSLPAQRGPALVKASPLRQLVAATSIGIVEGAALLDLCYEEDSQAEVDRNVVMTADGGPVETQATAEKGSYSRAQLNELIDLAEGGLREIFAAQRLVLGGV
jgi:ribonuclease PH